MQHNAKALEKLGRYDEANRDYCRAQHTCPWSALPALLRARLCARRDRDTNEVSLCAALAVLICFVSGAWYVGNVFRASESFFPAVAFRKDIQPTETQLLLEKTGNTQKSRTAYPGGVFRERSLPITHCTLSLRRANYSIIPAFSSDWRSVKLVFGCNALAVPVVPIVYKPMHI